MNGRSRPSKMLSLLAIPVLGAVFLVPPPTDVPLASLELSKMRVQPVGGRGGQAPNSAQPNKSIDGNPLRIGGREFAEGVGTRANSVLFVNVGGGSERFTAMVGVDDNPLPSPSAGAPATAAPPQIPIVFRVVGDGR